VRLTFVARRYPPAVGGVESFLRDLGQELSTRHQLTVLAQRIDNGPGDRLTDSLRPPPDFETFRDGRVLVKPFRASAARRAMMAPLYSQVFPVLRRYAYGRTRSLMGEVYARAMAPVLAAAAGPTDVIHMWGHDLVAVAAVRAARLVGAASVITPFAHRGQWGTDPASVAAYTDAGGLLALSQTDATLYRELVTDTTRVWVCGVCSPGVTAGGGASLRDRRGIRGPLVLFVGVRRPYKGFDVLVEAARLALERTPDLTFAFVGPGDPIRGGDPRLLDAGKVERDELAAWYDAADLLCLPSGGEIFPVTLLEAWSVATPVLTSDLPALVELVERSGGGRAVAAEPGALASAIGELCDNGEALSRMGTAGQRFWQQNATVEAVARCHEDVYTQLVAGNGGGG
jgi:glycosyltransferase involved in cell wall biosynthesis